MRWFGALLAVLLGLGCATLKSNQAVCAEYRELRCAGAPECSMDSARGCQVCQCLSGMNHGEGGLPRGIPPGF
ncbi:MAG TPA: hypothetical protein VGK67_05610 [Myxococcales bacterium]|jgi:hypothetical protein